MKKAGIFFLALTACLALGMGGISSKAYTEEEKAYVKSMLQAYGYSPDMAGANQAYQDYLSGKYNDICEQYGLPKQNVGGEASGSSDGQSSVQGEGAAESGSQAGSAENTEDGKIHFNQARSEEGVYAVTLREIWVEDAVQPPVIMTKSSRIDSQETDMAYADLVFEVTNEGTETLDVSELLKLTLNDHTRDYEESSIRKESTHGAELTEETTLEVGETGNFHYLTLVPKTSESFIGKAVLNGTSYEIRFDTTTHPSNRETLEVGETLEAADFAAVTVNSWSIVESSGQGETGVEAESSDQKEISTETEMSTGEDTGESESTVEEENTTEVADTAVEKEAATVDNSSETLIGGAKKLQLTAQVKNLSEEEIGSDACLGLLILADGSIYRGQAVEQEALASGEEKEVTLEAVLPGDVTEDAIQVLVYFDGSWRTVS